MDFGGHLSGTYHASKSDRGTHVTRFAAVAKQPLPPQVICQILGLDEETVKASFEAGKPPTASEDQLVEVCMLDMATLQNKTKTKMDIK